MIPRIAQKQRGVGGGHFKTIRKTLESGADESLAFEVDTGLLNKGLVEITYSLLGCDAVYVVRCVSDVHTGHLYLTYRRRRQHILQSVLYQSANLHGVTCQTR